MIKIHKKGGLNCDKLFLNIQGFMKFLSSSISTLIYSRHLRDKNDRLCTKLNDLRSELSEEVERLQKLLQDGNSYNLKNSISEKLQLKVHESYQDITGAESRGSHDFAAKILYGNCGAKNDSYSSNCPFQALIEYLIGMKLSVVNQTEGATLISSFRPLTCYAFSLTWVKKAVGEEPKLVYHVQTLGNFERIAPEWMRSDLMFSMSMFPIFFERIAKKIGEYIVHLQIFLK
ncbi:hypothetical protein K2173_005670 [Erythroxylum novogranatense]|uniref:DUF7806 domain-containing protein n=1 Tax=Erythroxylum novogranatense TaxID=1862640 RepID=A0AAV8SRA4_9ROSI|nr:hypothetical protein K2173_005670 [Erythroxylum novogranatense]